MPSSSSCDTGDKACGGAYKLRGRPTQTAPWKPTGNALDFAASLRAPLCRYNGGNPRNALHRFLAVLGGLLYLRVWMFTQFNSDSNTVDAKLDESQLDKSDPIEQYPF